MIDIDHHGAPDSAIELQNTTGAIKLFKKLRTSGFNALLISSNGSGGFHIRIRFGKPIAAKLAYQFGQWLASDWKKLGLSERPESFPKQPELAEGKFGNWVRLFGLHHMRDFYTQVYDGMKWLHGQAAIDFILVSSANLPEQIPAAARKFDGQPSGTEAGRAQHTSHRVEPAAAQQPHHSPTPTVLEPSRKVRAAADATDAEPYSVKGMAD